MECAFSKGDAGKQEINRTDGTGKLLCTLKSFNQLPKRDKPLIRTNKTIQIPQVQLEEREQ